MKKKFLKLATLGLLFSTLVACGPGEKRSAKQEKINQSLFPISYNSDKEAINGGVMKRAIVYDQPFKGILNIALYQEAVDNDFLEPIAPAIFYTDGDFQITSGGMFDMDLDVDNRVINVKMQKNLKWSDGEPITMDDYIFTYEVIAHKDYTGVRYDEGMKNIVGIEDFHNGKAKEISGLEKVNDYELKIHVKEVNPSIRAGGGGLSPFLIPKHYLQDIPVAKLEQSDKIRLKPLSYGPYKITQIIPGESIEYVPNEYWYDKKTMPKVEKYIQKILPSSSVISSMKIGEYDEYKYVDADAYKEYKDLDNLEILGRQELYYQYLGFNLGYWDEAKNENVYDPNMKMSDLNLRKAMAYSMDLEQVAKQFYAGLREKANSPIPPVFKDFYDPTPRYEYNPEKAKQILEEAGYKDVDGDGIREGKDGKPFSIKMAFSAAGDIAEPLSQQYIQNWEAVGLKVELASGRLMTSNFFPTIQSNKGFDIWVAAWGVGSAFELDGIYSKTAKFNFSRISDEKNEELMKEISSTKSIKDPEYRKAKVKEWNEYYMENIIGFLPILYRYELRPINKRIKEKTISYDSTVEVNFVPALTQTEALPAK